MSVHAGEMEAYNSDPTSSFNCKLQQIHACVGYIVTRQSWGRIVGGSNYFFIYWMSVHQTLSCCTTNTGTFTPMNVVEYKMQLIEGLVGKSLDDLSREGEGGDEIHEPVKMDEGVRMRCAYCALWSRNRRTRYQCRTCGVPLCSIGSGKVEDDCFTHAHESEKIKDFVWKKYLEMQKRTTNKNKN